MRSSHGLIQRQPEPTSSGTSAARARSSSWLATAQAQHQCQQSRRTVCNVKHGGRQDIARLKPLEIAGSADGVLRMLQLLEKGTIFACALTCLDTSAHTPVVLQNILTDAGTGPLLHCFFLAASASPAWRFLMQSTKRVAAVAKTAEQKVSQLLRACWRPLRCVSGFEYVRQSF